MKKFHQEATRHWQIKDVCTWSSCHSCIMSSGHQSYSTCRQRLTLNKQYDRPKVNKTIYCLFSSNICRQLRRTNSRSSCLDFFTSVSGFLINSVSSNLQHLVNTTWLPANSTHRKQGSVCIFWTYHEVFCLEIACLKEALSELGLN